MKILILGVNGFIGSSLSERILNTRDWHVYGMDIDTSKLDGCQHHDRFHFVEGDITINQDWVKYHIKQCDVVIPLVAIANPSVYISDPIHVFELDFEANLEIIRQCVAYKKHIIFPSTSEVYGMSPDIPFDEHHSNLVLGPIHKQRWIYACSKQLIDRLIFAYGDKQNLNYTLFRPFNWIGPKLDSLSSQKEGSPRVLTQFISNILYDQPIKLVDGGLQRRCFTDIDDGIDALMTIIERRDAEANRQIFNLGNPHNDLSIKELAELLIKHMSQYPTYRVLAEKTQIISVAAEDYYGKGYQDVVSRIPSIHLAQQYLDWEPTLTMDQSIKKTLDYHLNHSVHQFVPEKLCSTN